MIRNVYAQQYIEGLMIALGLLLSCYTAGVPWTGRKDDGGPDVLHHYVSARLARRHSASGRTPAVFRLKVCVCM
jgi:hypothetical protein